MSLDPQIADCVPFAAQVNGEKHCLGMDVLDQHAYAMSRIVAPVTMLATGGCGQVLVLSCSLLAGALHGSPEVLPGMRTTSLCRTISAIMLVVRMDAKGNV